MKKAVLSSIVTGKGTRSDVPVYANTSSDQATPGAGKHALDTIVDPSLRYRLNAGLNALAASPEQDWLAVAGREVLKILSVYESEVKEVMNLRSGVKLNLSSNINDVKWGNACAYHWCPMRDFYR
ncbi:uncharacterized protein EV422DRAFT_155133 [Fimicolochytrium jonesii]|uniref:uncharacterized protein n=1 Tax=Fimicolochytrium jonesii TaxID=1396493 RepID=UPI0022FF3E0C|nr:uncharacterized protein EV422DRAFT_155133 [Fimicolochytrium jonesii]KAI8826143.1 hypothetical protein EV422DRAFT_155133 [Fimicolochytrium jonesii]